MGDPVPSETVVRLADFRVNVKSISEFLVFPLLIETVLISTPLCFLFDYRVTECW
jgi:hypothetical protein